MSSCCTSPGEKGGGIRHFFPPWLILPQTAATSTTNLQLHIATITIIAQLLFHENQNSLTSQRTIQSLVLFYLTKQRNRVEQNLIKQALK